MTALPPPALLGLLLENIRDHAVFELDEHGRLLAWNPTIKRIFGYEKADLEGATLADLYTPSQRSPERVIGALDVARNMGRLEEEAEYQRKDGASFRGHAILLKTNEAGPAAFALLVRDLSILFAAQDQLHALATTDQLTGLANRQHMFDWGRIEYRRWRRYAVPLSMVIFDIDGLRDINTRHGEEVGDAVLRDMADILRQCTRNVDLAARLEGDLFCILLFSTPPEGAITLADRIRQATSKASFRAKGVPITVTTTLATITANSGAADFDAFFDAAEQGLRTAKQQGGNRVAML